MAGKQYRLVAADGREYVSDVPGQLGGHRGTRVYGQLDCPAALRALSKRDTYRRHRVFFDDEPTAIAAGFRPCARCMPTEYKVWKAHAAVR